MVVTAPKVTPGGSVSLTVTRPEVGVRPTFLAGRVYVNGCPCVGVPECVLVIARSDVSWVTDVGSVAVLLAVFVSPPPDTIAVLIKDAAALAATLMEIGRASCRERVESAVEGEQLTVWPTGAPQVQPVPLALVGVMPTGKVSLTVTVPEVGAVPTLLAVSVYVNPT